MSSQALPPSHPISRSLINHPPLLATYLLGLGEGGHLPKATQLVSSGALSLSLFTAHAPRSRISLS